MNYYESLEDAQKVHKDAEFVEHPSWKSGRKFITKTDRGYTYIRNHYIPVILNRLKKYYDTKQVIPGTIVVSNDSISIVDFEYPAIETVNISDALVDGKPMPKPYGGRPVYFTYFTETDEPNMEDYPELSDYKVIVANRYLTIDNDQQADYLFDKFMEINDLYLKHTGYGLLCYPFTNSIAQCLFADQLISRSVYRIKRLDQSLMIQNALLGGYHHRHLVGRSYVFNSSDKNKPYKEIEDYLLELDVNGAYADAMWKNRYPYGGYETYAWNELSTDKQQRLMAYITSRTRLGFVEIEDMIAPEQPLRIFEVEKSITTEQYLDGIDAGYEFTISKIMLFQFADYLFEDVVSKIYNLRLDPQTPSKVKNLCKDSINILNGIFCRHSFVKNYTDQDSPLYISAFVFYYHKQYLRKTINECCTEFPIHIKVDAFIIHASKFVGWDRISDKIGDLKIQGGKITTLVNKAKNTYYQYMMPDGSIHRKPKLE